MADDQERMIKADAKSSSGEVSSLMSPTPLELSTVMLFAAVTGALSALAFYLLPWHVPFSPAWFAQTNYVMQGVLAFFCLIWNFSYFQFLPQLHGLISEMMRGKCDPKRLLAVGFFAPLGAFGLAIPLGVGPITFFIAVLPIPCSVYGLCKDPGRQHLVAL